MRAWLGLLLTLGVFGLLLAACGANQPAPVHGVLTAVGSVSLTRADNISVRDDSGKIWRFVVAPDAKTHGNQPVSASHLRLHMGQGDPVTVTYRDDGGTLIATRIAD